MPLAKPGLQGKWGSNCYNEFFSYLCGFLKSYQYKCSSNGLTLNSFNRVNDFSVLFLRQNADLTPTRSTSFPISLRGTRRRGPWERGTDTL